MHAHLLVKIMSELHAVSHLSFSFTAGAHIFLEFLYAREITRGNMIPESVEFVALGANQDSEI